MSDRVEGARDAGAEPTLAPPPPAHGAVALESESAVRSGGIGGRFAAGAVGLVLLVGGVAFAATQVAGGGGASDPEAAVRELFAAIADEDVLGVLATLDPDEREVVSRPVEQLFDELQRLEVLDDSFELGGIAGIDLEFEDLSFRAEPVRDDLVRVHLTGGTASYAVDTDEIPIGDFLADTFDRFGVEYQGIEESESEQIDPEGTGETFLVARDTGDGWSVSIGYTAVEAARQSMGTEVPVAGAGLAAIGADTPEEAVEGFLRAAADIDVAGAVARLSPGELRAVHDYWPALVDEADLPTSQDVDVDIELTDLELRAETDGDRGRVYVDSIGIDVVTDDFEGGGTIVDGCIEVRGDVRESFEEEDIELPEGPICRDDIEDILEDATGDIAADPFGFTRLGGLGGIGLGDAETPTLGITVVRMDGGWFVAPLGTVADIGLAVLETLEREDLDAMVDAVEELFESFEAGFGSAYDEDFSFDEEFDEDLSFDEDLLDDGLGYDDGYEVDDGNEVADDVFDEDLWAPYEAERDAALSELVAARTADPTVAECTLAQLRATATPEQLWELADAHEYDFEPSPEAQDVLDRSLLACGG